MWLTSYHPGTVHRTTRLAVEVRDAIESDSLYGPLHDKQRHMVGIEYEVVLEHELRERGTFCG